MTPETKLKVVAEEIKEILRKHDVAGAFAIQTYGHGEFVLHLTTSQSCAYQYNDNEIRFYSKSSDYNSKEEQLQKQATTANMLRILTKTVAQNFVTLDNMSAKFDEITGSIHIEP